jgi:hypothetical protein
VTRGDAFSGFPAVAVVVQTLMTLVTLVFCLWLAAPWEWHHRSLLTALTLLTPFCY